MANTTQARVKWSRGEEDRRRNKMFDRTEEHNRRPGRRHRNARSVVPVAVVTVMLVPRYLIAFAATE
jgi:hypothetical protein